MKRLALPGTLAVLTMLLLAPAAPAATGDGDQATYPPDYFTRSKPEVIVQKRGKQAKAALFDGHWGWVHAKRLWSYRTAVSKSRGLRDASGASQILITLGLGLGGPAGAAAAGTIANAGIAIISNRIMDAALDSRRRGVRFEVGLWCYSLPVSPDPCRPRIVIKPR